MVVFLVNRFYKNILYSVLIIIIIHIIMIIYRLSVIDYLNHVKINYLGLIGQLVIQTFLNTPYFLPVF